MRRSLNVHCGPHQIDDEKETRSEPAGQPVGWAVKRQERIEPVWLSMKAFGKAGGGDT